MAKKKTEEKKTFINPNVVGLKGGVQEQPITGTLENNFMPYAMSVIVSRAIPEIDGFKPSHRKLLYTMYKMNLLNGIRTKSANIVGQTMRLNPHGDAAIYETMVRLSTGYSALLTPFVDSKGNFGKVFSRDMSYAASRYTEAKLSAISGELFRDIDKNTVDFVDNYDSTTKEPTLLPTTFPNILVSANNGIAAGMASSICGFNLTEVCQTAIAYLKDPECDLFTTLPAPDFSTGGEIIFDRAEMESIYNTGKGSFKIRSKWRYLDKENIIEVYEIPYTTTSEAIIDKVADLSKSGKIREVNDMRDETGLEGLKLAIDLKRGTNPELLMQKLFKLTPLQDSFACNFNILIGGNPRVMGIREILEEWSAWRTECVKRRVYHELGIKQDKLHLLQGLEKILLDIDKAIAIIRETERESEVVPNLMMGFGIDEIQAEYVAEIKLRNINREYILKHTNEIEKLEKDIADLKDLLNSRIRIRNTIIDELKQIIKKYDSPRRSAIVFASEVHEAVIEEPVNDYPVTIFLSREGYFKKISAQALRMSGEQKYKEGDGLMQSFETMNAAEVIFLTTARNAYKVKLSNMDDGKASTLGTYLATELEFEPGESIVSMFLPGDYKGAIFFAYTNGKIARIELSAFETKSNRRKLTGAYCDKAELCGIAVIKEESDLICMSSDERAIIFNSSLLASKTSRASIGVNVMSLKAKKTMTGFGLLSESGVGNVSRYRARSLPGAGAILKAEDKGEQQLSLI